MTMLLLLANVHQLQTKTNCEEDPSISSSILYPAHRHVDGADEEMGHNSSVHTVGNAVDNQFLKNENGILGRTLGCMQLRLNTR